MEDHRHLIIDDTLAEVNIVLTPGAQGHLRTTGIWGIILSIMGFLYSGIIIIGGISVMVMSSTMGLGAEEGIITGMGIFMTIIGLIFIVPMIFLLRFSILSLKAGASMKTYMLTDAISYLKTFFMSFGIITLLSVFLYFIWIFVVAAFTRGF
jgi:hypothetical protein